MDAIKRDGALVYDVPQGAEIRLIGGHPDYVAVCAHPDRPPWLVTHDGKEVLIPLNGGR